MAAVCVRSSAANKGPTRAATACLNQAAWRAVPRGSKRSRSVRGALAAGEAARQHPGCACPEDSTSAPVCNGLDGAARGITLWLLKEALHTRGANVTTCQLENPSNEVTTWSYDDTGRITVTELAGWRPSQAGGAAAGDP